MLKLKKWIVTLGIVTIGSTTLSGCQSVPTTSGGAVGIKRSQTMFISEANVQRDAASAYSQLISSANQQGLLNPDANQTARVKNIANRIIRHVGTFRQDALQWNWEVNVIKSKQLNAACMAGGKIYIYTGIIDRLQLTDDEIGAIIGHEVAHALREHIREKVSNAMMQQLAITAIAGLSKNMNAQKYAGLQIANKLMFDLPNSREQEREADKIGVELSARAGFDPNAGIRVWEKMAQAGGGGGIEFLNTHPSSSSRIDDIRKIVPAVYPLYLQARGNPANNSSYQPSNYNSNSNKYYQNVNSPTQMQNQLNNDEGEDRYSKGRKKYRQYFEKSKLN